ncbi:hypothetical protein [uncultured Eubacterium sp.]|uniref:hypothetical protein n=1 Tax=uncultured Eubacterium sp. TaxID=165185 RepID=UPI0025EE9644|nr:hypothetical protein [uncultured Eubacterium sp.]
MKKGYRAKSRWSAGFLLLLLVAVWLTAMPRQVWAADPLQDVKQMQEGIVSWKSSSEGEKELLAGDLLDQAGSAGSDWFAFDVARMGSATEEQRAAYLARLQDAVEAVYANKEDSMMRLRISDIHRMALTVIACGGDPENFGTDPDGNPINLINDTVWNSNSCWGDPGDQGINGYIWALLTIDAKNYQEPEGAEWTREKLVSELLSRQLADGGFGLIKTDPSDVDLTSMVLTALAPYQGQDKTYTYTGIISGQEETSTVDAVAEKAFARLSELQAEDGSMLTYDERTSESTAWAMIALASWGKDPEQDSAFIKNGKTLIDGMQEFCLDDGGIVHSLDGDEEETVGNNMAGYQTLYGLEAVRRLWEGQTRLFEMTDAQTVSADAIAAADAKLPALSDTDTTDTRSSEEVEADVSNRTLYLTAGIAGVIVVVVVIVLILVLKESKKKKAAAQNAQVDDDDDDEW